MGIRSRLELLFGVGLLAVALQTPAVPDFANAMRYTPPANYEAFELNHDPGDSPFVLDGPGFMLLAHDQDGQINFQVGLVGYSIGEGKVVTYQHVGSAELKKLLEESVRSKLQAAPPATLRNTSGLTTADWAGQSSAALMNVRWIQIETNLVLKIRATARNTNAFAALTNSLRTLTINKKHFLESLQPKPPTITRAFVDKIEVGYMNWRGRRTAAFVFRSKTNMFCFAAADGGNPEREVNASLPSIASMRDRAHEPTTLRMAFVDIGRTGDGPEDYQTTMNFFTETNTAAIAELTQGIYHGPLQLMLWDSWTNQEPQAFQKVAEYQVNATLLRRKDP